MEEINNTNNYDQPINNKNLQSEENTIPLIPPTNQNNKIFKIIFFITIILLFGLAIYSYINDINNLAKLLPTINTQEKHDGKSKEINNQVDTVTHSSDMDESNYLKTTEEDIQETSNKARDMTVLNDSSELLNAIERYYATNNHYPWQKNSDSESKILERINSTGWIDSIFAAEELKIGFRDKLLNPNDKFTVFHNEKDGTYICVNPKSQDKIASAKSRCSTDSEISNTILCLSGSELMCVP